MVLGGICRFKVFPDVINVFPLCAVGVMGAKPGVVAVDL